LSGNVAGFIKDANNALTVNIKIRRLFFCFSTSLCDRGQILYC